MVGRLDAHRQLAAPVVADPIQVWPIVTDAPGEVGEFMTLQEAQAKKLAIVREVGGGQAAAQVDVQDGVDIEGQVHEDRQFASDGAQVNRLEIENQGDVGLLVCAGTLVAGGQQNRQIGQDFVVPPHTTVAVDAFCVEQGRWSGLSACFEACPTVATKEIRASAQYSKDQGEVWARVAEANQRAATPVALVGIGGSMSEERTADVLGNLPTAETVLYISQDAAKDDPRSSERHQELGRRIRARFDELRSSGAHVIGFAYAVDGKPMSVRVFAHPKLFESQMGPFIEAMCSDADISARAPGGEPSPLATVDDVLALVRDVANEPGEIVTTAAGNDNCYRHGQRAAASACLLKSLGSAGPALTEDWTAK
jgi:hypothetical protein